MNSPEEHQFGRPTGFPCPECKFIMKVTIEQLLYGKRIECPSCGLVLSVNKEKSKKSLKLLQDLHVAIKNVESMKKQSF